MTRFSVLEKLQGERSCSEINRSRARARARAAHRRRCVFPNIRPLGIRTLGVLGVVTQRLSAIQNDSRNELIDHRADIVAVETRVRQWGVPCGRRSLFAYVYSASRSKAPIERLRAHCFRKRKEKKKRSSARARLLPSVRFLRRAGTRAPSHAVRARAISVNSLIFSRFPITPSPSLPRSHFEISSSLQRWRRGKETYRRFVF